MKDSKIIQAQEWLDRVRSQEAGNQYAIVSPPGEACIIAGHYFPGCDHSKSGCVYIGWVQEDGSIILYDGFISQEARDQPPSTVWGAIKKAGKRWRRKNHDGSVGRETGDQNHRTHFCKLRRAHSAQLKFILTDSRWRYIQELAGLYNVEFDSREIGGQVQYEASMLSQYLIDIRSDLAVRGR